MAVEFAGSDLPFQVMISLAAGVLAVPLLRQVGLSAIPGYILAGFLIGPMLGVVSDGETILHLAEIGVVLFLFLIGLEMEPRTLWRMKGDIIGTGALQMLLGTTLLASVALFIGLPFGAAVIAGTAFMLTSTATVVQLLKDRRLLTTANGQGILGILLFEDILIVPLLLSVQLFSPTGSSEAEALNFLHVAASAALMGCMAALSRWGLTSLFRAVAATGQRDLMTGAALLVVLGVAFTMNWIGLSMAFGAFMAGLVLSHSSFRVQLEAEIEPFKGILLALFFLAVGLNISATSLYRDFGYILGLALLFMAAKGLVVYFVARAVRSDRLGSLERAAIMAQGGEFAFVLVATALAGGLIDANAAAALGAAIAISMAVTPIILRFLNPIFVREEPLQADAPPPPNEKPHVLIIGFGRFGQVVSQPLFASGYRITLIDTDGTMIREAADYGFKIYYGDGGRVDILKAAGAETAKAIIVCVDDPVTVSRILRMVAATFPHVPVLARAFDREHVLELTGMGAHFYVKETFESALALSKMALEVLGETPETASTTVEEVRQIDIQRSAREMKDGLLAGRAFIFGNTPTRGGTVHLGRQNRIKKIEHQAYRIGLEASPEETVGGTSNQSE